MNRAYLETEQFSIQAAYETEQEAREASRDLSLMLIEQLKDKGFTKFIPAPKPEHGVIWDEFAGCRILIQYILPGSWLRDSEDKFALRVDTIASKDEDV